AEGVSLLGGGGGVGRNRRTRHAWGVSGSGGFWPMTLRFSALRGFCRADQAKPSSAGGVGFWWVLADDAALFGPTGGVGRMRRSRHPPGRFVSRGVAGETIGPRRGAEPDPAAHPHPHVQHPVAAGEADPPAGAGVAPQAREGGAVAG